jgi:AraC-like DNA-binding protein
LFISARQLHRRFVAALGYGPKTLQRILRFQAFLALSHAHADDGSLTRLAAAAGYADQAHLSRECSRLAGLTPSAFLEAMHRSCDASHDHAASFALSQALLSKQVRSS